MTRINKKDFVEIEYTGKIKDGIVFDTTNVEIAKENNIYNEKMSYVPVVVCVGEHQIIKGLDKYLEGREVGEEYEVNLKPEESFGKKDAKLLKMVPMSVFKKQNITPFPGLQLNIDNTIGTVRTVTGGRTIVDFNHPLAGRDMIYKIKIKRLVKDKKEKINSYFKTQFNITNADVEIKEDKAEVDLKIPLPKEAVDKLKEKLIKITNIKSIEFKQEKKEEKKETKEEGKTEEPEEEKKEVEEEKEKEETGEKGTKEEEKEESEEKEAKEEGKEKETEEKSAPSDSEADKTQSSSSERLN